VDKWTEDHRPLTHSLYYDDGDADPDQNDGFVTKSRKEKALRQRLRYPTVWESLLTLAKPTMLKISERRFTPNPEHADHLRYNPLPARFPSRVIAMERIG